MSSGVRSAPRAMFPPALRTQSPYWATPAARRSADPGQTGSWLITRAREVPDAVGGGMCIALRSPLPCRRPRVHRCPVTPIGSRLQVLPVQPVRLDGTSPAPVAQERGSSPVIPLRSAGGRAECLDLHALAKETRQRRTRVSRRRELNHLPMRACCPLTFSLVARHDRAGRPLDPANHHRMCRHARVDRQDCLVPPHAPAGAVAARGQREAQRSHIRNASPEWGGSLSGARR